MPSSHQAPPPARALMLFLFPIWWPCSLLKHVRELGRFGGAALMFLVLAMVATLIEATRKLSDRGLASDVRQWRAAGIPYTWSIAAYALEGGAINALAATAALTGRFSLEVKYSRKG